MIQISLLGSWQLHNPAEPIKKEPRRKEQGLLAYLAVETGQAHSRDSLIGLFWPNLPISDARNNLRVALSRLKRHLGNNNNLKSTRHTVRLILSDKVNLDVNRFFTLVQQTEMHDHQSFSACQSCQTQLKQAVNLYRGEFLTGFYLEDCVAFEEWLFVWRERLHVQMLKLLGSLVGAADENGRFQHLEQYARRQIELDPLHEPAHRQLMRAQYAQGQRNTALNQFQTCQAILKEQLGIEPAPETISLQKEIQANTLLLSNQTASVHRGHVILPETTTPFVGRETELEQLAQRFAERQYRLISLVGPGGIGKTRLAIQAARIHLDAFPDGVYFVSLEGVQSAAEIPSAIAEAMEISFAASSMSPQAEMRRILQEKNLLLIIDNLEHVIDEAADFLLDLIRHAPKLVLLITSRERLNAQVEDLFRLGGLPYPEPDVADNAGRYAAVRLFVDRAHRLNKSFRLTKTNLPDVITICHLVEGLPLGVELAATWIRDLSARQIALSLQEDFNLLETDLRDVSPRHRSMAKVFEHSWGLLQGNEQAVLAQLSVFRGGFTLAAAKAVTGASTLLLTRLHYKSLIRGSGDGRYTMHELIRQLSQNKLQDGLTTKAKHCHYFLTLLQEQAPRLNGEDAAKIGALLRLDLDNIRQAWRWAVHHAAFDLLKQSTNSLATFLLHEGLAFEGAQLLQNAIDVVQAETITEEYLLPLLLVKQIKLLEGFKSLDEIAVLIQQLLSITEQKPELAHFAAEAYLSWTRCSLTQEANPKLAQVYLDQAAQIAETVNDKELTAWLLCEKGRNSRYDGQFEQAIDALNKALALFEELKHLPGQATVYSHLAPAYAEAYLLGPALFCDRKALDLYIQIDNRSKLGVGHHNLGETYLLLGANAQAKDHFEKSLAFYRRQGDKVYEANTLSAYANALHGLGQTDAAENYYRLAIARQKELRLNFSLSFSLLDWATFQQEQEWLAEAEITLDEALELNSDLDHLKVTTQAQLATIYLTQGNRIDKAFGLADSVWEAIAPNEGAGLPFPIKTMFECYLVFKVCGDERTAVALQMAEKTLKKTAVAIEDPQMQTYFLNNVPVNKMIRRTIEETRNVKP